MYQIDGSGVAVYAQDRQFSRIFLSNDNGSSFRAIPKIAYLDAFEAYPAYPLIAMSDDNLKIVVVHGNMTSKSADGGITWATPQVNDIKYWRSLQSSFDGQILFAIAWSRRESTTCLFKSTDGGATWTKLSIAGNPSSINVFAMSGDGNKVVVCDSYGYVYTTTDAGATWTTKTVGMSMNSWNSISMSSDGAEIVLTADTGYSTNSNGVEYVTEPSKTFICKSTDFCNSAQKITSLGVHCFTATHVSPDGHRIVAKTRWPGNRAYLSLDNGSTWAEEFDEFVEFDDFAMNSDSVFKTLPADQSIVVYKFIK